MMKSIFCFMVLIGGFVNGDSIQAQPGMPPLPPPPPITLPSCPFQLMGQINGIYYWQTKKCPADATSGFAQSLTNLPVPCCSNATGSWVCNCGVSVVMSAAKVEEPAAVQSQESLPKAVQSPEEAIAIVTSPACDLPQGTAVEADAKLQAIVVECEALETHLKTLAGSSEVQNTDVKNQKSRVKAWLVTVTAMLDYLKNGSDATTVKITNYCDAFLRADQNHQRAWHHSSLPVGGGKTQQIANEQQPGPLLPAASVSFDTMGTTNVTATVGPVIRVNVKNAGVPDKKVYFQTFKVFHQPPGVPISSFYSGVQVEEPMSGVVKQAVFIDRHNFGHKVRIPGTGETFLVSSVDDLGISN